MYSRNVVQFQLIAASIALRLMSSARSMLFTIRSRCFDLPGASVKPQLPMTTVVTPCQQEQLPSGSQNTWASMCVWPSMKPGVTTWPVASSSSLPFSAMRPIAAIRSPFTAPSARYFGSPVPSTTVPFRITRSYMWLSPVLNRRALPLLRGGRERRQFTHVARVVLDDYGRLEARGDLLEAVDRGERLRAAAVEGGHAVGVVVLLEMREIAGQEQVALLLRIHQQAAMARRVPRGVQDQHGAIAEHVLVSHQRLVFPASAHPVRERRRIHARRRLGIAHRVPVALADQEHRLRERGDLPGVIAVIVADAV